MSITSAQARDRASWKQAAARAQPRIETRLYIDGEYVDALDGGRFATVNPADGEVIAEMAAGTSKDVDRAVAAARRAFKSGAWAKMAPRARMAVLYRFADLIDEHAEELAVLETLDMGKPIADVVNVDLPAVCETLRYFAECIDKVEGSVTSTASNIMHFVLREPVGVVAAITPWNYPLLMATWKIAPALAAGNSVVLKPAEQAPMSCLRLAALFVEAGGPPGVLNVVNGDGEVAGQALARHMDVAKVSFTGSTEVGKLMLQYAGLSNMKRVALECGGKSPHIVTKECGDLDAAAMAVAWGVFYNQGEVCNAGSRLLVHEAVKDELLEKVVAVAGRIQPGDPLDPKTRMGAIVDETQLGRVLGYIESGKSEGAGLHLGGARVREDTGGYYVEPTIFDAVSNDMTIAREEIFGPVLSALSFSELDEAIAVANDTIYGLSAGIWTDDVNVAHRAARAIKAGIVWVNTFDAGDISSPFGGFKQSGFGRDKSIHALDKFTDLKAIWIALRD